MNQVIPFNFENHPVRTVVIDQVPWWVGKDVAGSLGFKDVVNAIKQHCRGVVKYHPIIDALGRTQEVRIINEPDVFRLITNSHLPQAQRFERWLFEEALPQIRKTGAYVPAGMVVTLDSKALIEANDTLKAAIRRIQNLETERNHLRERERLQRRINKLETQLAKKNTPLTDAEKEQIKLFGKNASAGQIARMINRSPSTVRRVLKEAGL
jgi:prophage antirepressor-like protein